MAQDDGKIVEEKKKRVNRAVDYLHNKLPADAYHLASSFELIIGTVHRSRVLQMKFNELVPIPDSILDVALEQARNAARSAQVVIHKHSDVEVDGTPTSDSSVVRVTAHAADDELLVSVAHAVGMVIPGEVGGEGGGRGDRGMRR